MKDSKRFNEKPLKMLASARCKNKPTLKIYGFKKFKLLPVKKLVSEFLMSKILGRKRFKDMMKLK
jgi:hypothetical protein